MTKIYLAHSIATVGEAQDSIRVANNLRELGFEVYVASENKAINDKSNDPTPEQIFEGDINEILSSDLFVVNLNGGTQDGTISEIGFVAGFNEVQDDKSKIPIIAYTSNTRILQPQHHHGVPSASANHLVLGMIERNGEFVGDEQNLKLVLEMISHRED